MSTPYRFYDTLHTLTAERRALETQLKAAFYAYRAEQAERHPVAWMLDGYRTRINRLAAKRRELKDAAAVLHLASAGTE